MLAVKTPAVGNLESNPGAPFWPWGYVMGAILF
jgi:hypothetical protein